MIPKYRAWDRSRQHMCLVDSMEWDPHGNVRSVNLNYYGAYYTATNMDQIVLMQATPVKDRDDREIYDHDIIDCSVYKKDMEYAIVKWDEVSNGWCYTRGGKSWPFAYTGIKVIGNVYENPGLIAKSGICDMPIEDLWHEWKE